MRPLTRWLSAAMLATTVVACRDRTTPDAARDAVALDEAASATSAVSAVGAVSAEANFRGRGIAAQGAAGGEEDAAANAAPAAPPSPKRAAPPPAFAGDAPAPDADGTAPMVVRVGSATLEVDSLDAGVTRVREVVRTIPGAYVANMSFEGGRDQPPRATLEVKVPAAAFERLVSGLGPIGRVETVNVAAQDVTEEFVDATARAENARRLEARLVDLLARRAGKLQEVLAVERELARVREEIERYEGRLRFLRTRAAMSTLAITVHEPTPVLGERAGTNPIAEAFRESWRNFVGLVALVISLSGVLVPLAVLGYVAWRLVRRFHRATEAKPA